jgi:chromate transporter
MADRGAAEAVQMNHPLTLFWIMFRASLFSTTGTGNLPIVHQDLLARGWATDRQFAESLAIGQISPGPTGLWVISLGYLVGGLRGAALTLLAISLPPLLVLLLVHGFYRRWGHHAATQGFVRGLGLAVAGIFVIVLTSVMNTAGWTWTNLLITVGAIALGATRRVPVLVVLLLAAIVGIALFGTTHVQAQTVPDLKTVLERAQSYLTAFEEQLGTLIGEEDYRQTAIWDGRKPGGFRVGEQQRRLTSDFLVTRVGEHWFGVRNVLMVDRKPVKEKSKDFSAILANSPDSVVQALMDISNNNWRYNIGDFTRTFNLPTYPLTILHASNFHRFNFEKGPEIKIGNVLTWEVRFFEVAHPAMIRDLSNNDQLQHGRLWIDPNTGKILKTETLIDARTGNVRAKVDFVVSYKQSPKLDMLVLDTMHEKYDTDFHHVDCVATYSNFHRFETEVKLDVGPIQ